MSILKKFKEKINLRDWKDSSKWKKFKTLKNIFCTIGGILLAKNIICFLIKVITQVVHFVIEVGYGVVAVGLYLILLAVAFAVFGFICSILSEPVSSYSNTYVDDFCSSSWNTDKSAAYRTQAQNEACFHQYYANKNAGTYDGWVSQNKANAARNRANGY